MGYFSNGTEGEMYEAQWCSRCVHQEDEQGRGCAVWGAHLFRNYEECNNEKSILHELIPREGIHNGQCRMFWQKADTNSHEQWLRDEGLSGAADLRYPDR